jgi:hypothetical protein
LPIVDNYQINAGASKRLQQGQSCRRPRIRSWPLRQTLGQRFHACQCQWNNEVLENLTGATDICAANQDLAVDDDYDVDSDPDGVASSDKTVFDFLSARLIFSFGAHRHNVWWICNLPGPQKPPPSGPHSRATLLKGGRSPRSRVLVSHQMRRTSPQKPVGEPVSIRSFNRVHAEAWPWWRLLLRLGNSASSGPVATHPNSHPRWSTLHRPTSSGTYKPMDVGQHAQPRCIPHLPQQELSVTTATLAARRP